MSEGTQERPPLRRPLGLLLAGAAAAFALARRSDYVGDDPKGPASLDAWDGREAVVTLPAHADPRDASGAIDAALDRLRRHGRGGTLRLPPGDWTIDEPIILDRPGLRLAGAGVRATRLHQRAGVRGHMVNVNADGVTVERLTLRGAGTDDPGLAGHGIRVGHSAADVVLRDLVVEEVPSYGIGFQPRDAQIGAARIGGLFDDLCLRNVVVRRCGQDGIDLKNIDETVAACRSVDVEVRRADCNGRRSFVRNVSVTAVAQAPDAGIKPGIDVRGVRSLQNVELAGLRGDGFGIRFRNSDGGPPNGFGGHGSTLDNFLVEQETRLAPPVERTGTHRVQVHNGFTVVDGEVLHHP